STSSPPPQIYTLSLHDALPISGCHQLPQQAILGEPAEEMLVQREVQRGELGVGHRAPQGGAVPPGAALQLRQSRGHVDEAKVDLDRKSTRLNSSHRTISYAVFC